MIRNFLISIRTRVLSSPIGAVLVLFQRGPLIQMLFPEARLIGAAGLGEITTWTIATVAGLGAYDTVAGATTISQLQPNPGSTTVPAAKGASLAFVFQVTGTESSPKSWQIVGALPPGLVHSNATGNTVNSISGTPTQTGNFNFTVKAWEGSNNSGNVVSQAFTINVGAAIITSQPESTLILSGDTATLTVGAAAGSTYQWYRGNSGVTNNPINNENSASFTTPALSATTKYWVRVTKGGFVSDSDAATVTIGTVPNITTQPVSKTINSGTTTTLNVVASGTSPSYQWYRGPSGITSNPVANATSSSFTTPALTTDTSYWVRASNSLGSDNSAAATISIRIPPAIETQPIPVTIDTGNTASLTVIASGTDPTFQWYQGISGNVSNPVNGATGNLFTTSILTTTTNFWVRATNAAGIADSESVTVTVNTPPTITTEPLSTAVNSGGTATLTTTATGTSPNFQWYVGETGETANPIPEATLPSFTTPPLAVTTRYWVRASNALGIDDSQTATVTVQEAPVFTDPPDSTTINSGTTATFTFTATGTSPTFQWYLGVSGDISQPIPDATGNTYTTPSLTESTTYWVRASSIAGNTDSATVTAHVVTPPGIAANPESVTINQGGSASLSVSASGTTPAYQWYRGASGDTSDPIAGATSGTFTTPALTATTSFWARAANSAGNADSAAAVVTVRIPPSITRQPLPVTIKKGKKATLTVAFSGTTPATFQWYKGTSGNTASPVAGAKSATFTTPALKKTTSYWVRVNNAAGSVNSKTVTVKVKATKAPAAAGVAPPVSQTGSYQAWKDSHFPSSVGTSGPGDDPDGDGIPNSSEYILGLHPLASDSTPSPAIIVTAGMVHVTFTATAASGPGYEGFTRLYSLETADRPNPSLWVGIPGFTEIAGNGQTVDFAAPAAEPAAFYRLRVRLVP